LVGHDASHEPRQYTFTRLSSRVLLRASRAQAGTEDGRIIPA
jgi:hypothetical protein